METVFSLRAGNHSPDETKPVIEQALKREKSFAHTRFIRFEKECGQFEIRHSMDSEQFLAKFESGQLGDDAEWFDWYAAVRGKKIWETKFNILEDISWNR
jgi:hypothetical protein